MSEMHFIKPETLCNVCALGWNVKWWSLTWKILAVLKNFNYYLMLTCHSLQPLCTYFALDLLLAALVEIWWTSKCKTRSPCYNLAFSSVYRIKFHLNSPNEMPLKSLPNCLVLIVSLTRIPHNEGNQVNRQKVGNIICIHTHTHKFIVVSCSTMHIL